MSAKLGADQFVKKLKALRSTRTAKPVSHLASDRNDVLIGVRMGKVFTLAKELFDLYIRRHDRINSWDLVDRSAPCVVGGYPFDKPRKILYELARSQNMPERRSAIVRTGFFIRQGDMDDTFGIAEMLLDDDRDLIHKAVGRMLRAAGGIDRQRLLNFLDKYAAIMPRTALRYAIEHLDKKQRDRYLGMKKEQSL
jgi:3-methyladenine DNA glycosylase AlkD